MGKSRNQMNPLEENLVQLLRENKEQNGINALHYLEALYTLSRVTTMVFESKADALAKICEGKITPDNFKERANDLQWGLHYMKLFGELKNISIMIGKLRDEQSENNQIEDALQAERKNT